MFRTDTIAAKRETFNRFLRPRLLLIPTIGRSIVRDNVVFPINNYYGQSSSPSYVRTSEPYRGVRLGYVRKIRSGPGLIRSRVNGPAVFCPLPTKNTTFETDGVVLRFGNLSSNYPTATSRAKNRTAPPSRKIQRSHADLLKSRKHRPVNVRRFFA